MELAHPLALNGIRCHFKTRYQCDKDDDPMVRHSNAYGCVLTSNAAKLFTSFKCLTIAHTHKHSREENRSFALEMYRTGNKMPSRIKAIVSIPDRDRVALNNANSVEAYFIT